MCPTHSAGYQNEGQPTQNALETGSLRATVRKDSEWVGTRTQMDCAHSERAQNGYTQILLIHSGLIEQSLRYNRHGHRFTREIKFMRLRTRVTTRTHSECTQNGRTTLLRMQRAFRIHPNHREHTQNASENAQNAHRTRVQTPIASNDLRQPQDHFNCTEITHREPECTWNTQNPLRTLTMSSECS
jgi:hypothetical protein